MENPIVELVQAHNSGRPLGIYSICSSNSFVIRACMEQEIESNRYLLIESTSNQVNQFGGYTGMNPRGFADYVFNLADNVGFPRKRILLGGDHLGPNVWRGELAQQAMSKACKLISDCVKAGYSKIHLDASMKCADDDPNNPLDVQVAAGRTAVLCRAAEEAFALNPTRNKPCYVIGTEVPNPGGSSIYKDKMMITDPANAKETIIETKNAFYSLGLEDAWENVIALVVQPGVEFGDDSVIRYDRNKAKSLSNFINGYENLVYEAHSTDFQTPQSLNNMVEDHFAILKVGPALTFSLREAIFALERIERELLSGRKSIKLSNLEGVLENKMLENPDSWIQYYKGDEIKLRFSRKYSYSDRIRYYWTNEEVSTALKILLSNLSKITIPESLLSMFMPDQYRKVFRNELENAPLPLISDKIQSRITDYIIACKEHI